MHFKWILFILIERGFLKNAFAVPGSDPQFDFNSFVRELPRALTQAQRLFIEYLPVGSVVPIEAPETLYHWTNQEILNQVGDQVLSTREMPLMDSMMRTNFAHHFPEFQGKRGIFSWSNPVTAMGAESMEMYGDKLMRLKLKKNARAYLMISDVEKVQMNPLELEKYDVVLHVEKTTGKGGKLVNRIQEWIVLNPKAIESVSADPQVLRAEVLPWYERIAEAEFRFLESDLHFHGKIYEPGFNRDFFVKSKLKRWLDLKSGDVPVGMRGSSGYEGLRMSWIVC